MTKHKNKIFNCEYMKNTKNCSWRARQTYLPGIARYCSLIEVIFENLCHRK